MYVDKFGTSDILTFAKALDYSIGAIRIDKKNIVKEAPVKYLRDRSHNLLDVIAGAYLSEEVISYLLNDQYAKRVYTDRVKEVKDKDVNDVVGKGVQRRYIRAVEEYYSKDADWNNREQWGKYR